MDKSIMSVFARGDLNTILDGYLDQKVVSNTLMSQNTNSQTSLQPSMGSYPP